MPAISTMSPGRRTLDALGDGGRAVLDHVVVRARPGDDLVDDRARILAARIVAGDDHLVGEARGDCPHQRPLAGIAVAAAAEDADEASAGHAALRPAARARAACPAPSPARPACARSRRRRADARRRPGARTRPGIWPTLASASPPAASGTSDASSAARQPSRFAALKRPKCGLSSRARPQGLVDVEADAGRGDTQLAAAHPPHRARHVDRAPEAVADHADLAVRELPRRARRRNRRRG